MLTDEAAQRLKRLLERFKLPTTVKVSPDKVIDAIQKDKKRSGDNVHFVFLNRIGNAIVNEIPLDTLQSHARDWLQAINQDD